MTVKKVLILSLIGLLIVTVTMAGIFFFMLNKNNNKEKKVEHFHYELGELYTNIKDSSRILKINITVEYTNKKLQEVLEAHRAKITNDILELLRNKTYKELIGQPGQQKARMDILSLVKKDINSEEISNIYFVEFIIQ
ncbi:Flagellar basal body-associated protein FliL [Caminicella sporogenes DSM 14501]|uniref:Flagellar protein FliL n=1 Tax=Caminicella sporogenes DSM 14501 TaxID=1121266 RepID=A0A1M6LBU6_9FIRM|nr:flagellar basal body-associated FliL family protein [Caminicella sporogenes]RKD27778.1 hypothetical protein BET04_01545 [Caminicella sporogenes]SHJ68638.1 Flagellar basal body-associated protein FliL [Caminicella sporogenes DSM 14501]